MQREDVWFHSGSDRISAWLYRPDGSGKMTRRYW